MQGVLPLHGPLVHYTGGLLEIKFSLCYPGRPLLRNIQNAASRCSLHKNLLHGCVSPVQSCLKANLTISFRCASLS